VERRDAPTGSPPEAGRAAPSIAEGPAIPAAAGLAEGASDAAREPAEGAAALAEAFDLGAFRRLGLEIVERVAAHLEDARAGRGAVLPSADAAALVERFALPPEGRVERGPLDVLSSFLDAAQRLHHPRFLGHQVSAPAPAAALASLVRAATNNGMAVFEMGPAAVAMERAVLSRLRALAGLPPAADGVLVSGGSLGNLTALLAARQARAGFDVWERGVAHGPPLAIACSDQAHYSVERAARVLGLGRAGVVTVPSDARFRMSRGALAAVLDAADAAGRRVFAIVASAGSTATGALDPLDAIADECAARGLWLHVDGAHGASLCFSPRLRARVAGLGRADSLVWDLHKLALVPSLCTALLYRDARSADAAFAQDASYLLPSSPESEAARWRDGAARTLECTRPALSLEPYLLLATHGVAAIAAHVERLHERAAELAALVEGASDLELAVRPESNIVCFRWLPPALRDGGRRGAPVADLRALPRRPALDALQDAIRARVVASGEAYLVRTALRGHTFLRVTVMSPATRTADLERLLDAVRAVGAEEAAA
jgi:L-2,4-diaminobutyrate decarboxylase